MLHKMKKENIAISISIFAIVISVISLTQTQINFNITQSSNFTYGCNISKNSKVYLSNGIMSIETDCKIANLGNRATTIYKIESVYKNKQGDFNSTDQQNINSQIQADLPIKLESNDVRYVETKIYLPINLDGYIPDIAKMEAEV